MRCSPVPTLSRAMQVTISGERERQRERGGGGGREEECNNDTTPMSHPDIPAYLVSGMQSHVKLCEIVTYWMIYRVLLTLHIGCTVTSCIYRYLILCSLEASYGEFAPETSTAEDVLHVTGDRVGSMPEGACQRDVISN